MFLNIYRILNTKSTSVQIQILLLEAQSKELGLENLQPMDQASISVCTRLCLEPGTETRPRVSAYNLTTYYHNIRKKEAVGP